MESCDSGVTSPVLRVTAEITEIKEKHERSGNRNYSVSPSLTSRECKSHPACTKKKFLKPLYGYNPYERSNCGGSYVSSQHNPKNNVSSFTQRVMSAKLLRMKQLQNQLYETQAKLNEVMQENRTLKTVQQRQDSVLKKYEGNQEQLPQLMRSHHEEIRVLNEKYKQIRNNYKELESRLKQKDNELTNLREQHKHLLKLSKDKHLGEREKLSKKVEEMQTTIDEQRKKIFMLSKKLDLEEKSFNHQLNQEVAKHKKVQSELQSALETINNLKASLEAKERLSTVSFRRPLQNSEKNPQTSLRVSFRQPQQQTRTDNAAEQESETTDDSFTMNYSPVAHRSSSLESVSSGSAKEQKESDNKTQPGNNSYVSILNTKLKNGLKISRNSANITINEVSKYDQNSVIGKKELMFKTEESKVRRKLQGQRAYQRTPPTIKAGSRRSSFNKLANKTNDKESEKIDQASSEEQIKKNVKEKPVSSSAIENTETKTGKTNVDVADKSEKIDNDMKLDLDSEFEKYFQNTQLSDEAINEFYQKDFREEIYELERKFQELNQQNNEKIENMKVVNRLSHIATSSAESESDDINSSTVPQWEESKNIEKETSNITENLTLSETKPTIPFLGETQKADLLKALSSIDNASNKNAQDDRIELPQIAGNPILTSEMSYLDKVNEIKKSYSRTRRKSEVMKDLFGADAAVLKS